MPGRAVTKRQSSMATLNVDVAARLDEIAALLQEQHANPFRVQAYQRAAETVRRLDESVFGLIEREGLAGLEALPGIGHSLARSIYQAARTGRVPMLARLRGEADAVDLIASVPGIGKRTAERIHDELSIDSLEALETAAHDGRLTQALGLRGKRLAGVRDALAGRLNRARSGVAVVADPPPVEELLSVDRQYRDQAVRGQLPKIAPRRFNESQQAWLPVLHTDRAGRHYTALYSNTARAHALGRTHDWVVLFVDGGRGEHQYTVVTEGHGALAGKRVVRGLEPQCVQYYATH